VLLVGAGDPVAQALALRLTAYGAAIVVAGPQLPAVLTTAGLAAASGATARVVEEASPPLLGTALLAAARQALAAPTDVVVAAAAFSSPTAAEDALRPLAAAVAPGGEALLLDAKPAGGTKSCADAAAARFLTRAAADPSSVPGPGRDG